MNNKYKFVKEKDLCWNFINKVFEMWLPSEMKFKITIANVTINKLFFIIIPKENKL